MATVMGGLSCYCLQVLAKVVHCHHHALPFLGCIDDGVVGSRQREGVGLFGEGDEIGGSADHRSQAKGEN